MYTKAQSYIRSHTNMYTKAQSYRRSHTNMYTYAHRIEFWNFPKRQIWNKWQNHEQYGTSTSEKYDSMQYNTAILMLSNYSGLHNGDVIVFPHWPRPHFNSSDFPVTSWTQASWPLSQNQQQDLWVQILWWKVHTWLRTATTVFMFITTPKKKAPHDTLLAKQRKRSGQMV